MQVSIQCVAFAQYFRNHGDVIVKAVSAQFACG